MGKGFRQVRRFLRADEGPTTAEYAVMLALVLGMVIAAITSVGNTAADWWQEDADAVTTTTTRTS